MKKTLIIELKLEVANPDCLSTSEQLFSFELSATAENSFFSSHTFYYRILFQPLTHSPKETTVTNSIHSPPPLKMNESREKYTVIMRLDIRREYLTEKNGTITLPPQFNQPNQQSTRGKHLCRQPNDDQEFDFCK